MSNVEHVAVDVSTGEPLPREGSLNHRTNEQGSFRIGGLSRHLYHVTVRPRDERLARSSKLVDIEYTLRDERGEFVLRSQVWQAAPFPLQLAPGRYTLQCERDGAPLGAPHEVVLVDRAVSLQLP